MAKANGYTLTEHQRYWLKHVQACEASGKSIAAYAREHGLEAKAMYSGKTILVTRSYRFPSFPLQINDGIKMSLRKLGQSVQLGRTGIRAMEEIWGR
jgi:hypothetical protein